MSISPHSANSEREPRADGGDYSAQAAPNTPIALRIPMQSSGSRVDAVLAALLPQYSRSRLQAWLKQGAILVDGAQLEPSAKVAGGERVSLAAPPEPAQLAACAEDIALEVLFEDADLIVINKPAGLVVHPGHGNWSGTLLNALLRHHPPARELPRAGIVHRLDKETSGLLVVAKTLTAQTSLVRQLQARSVTRRYLAVVEGAPPARGTVDAPIGRHPTQRTKMAVNVRGREALTEFRVIERLGRYSLLELKLHTGRTHQIRVHMQSLGHPLVGDPVYRARKHAAAGSPAAEFARQALHAAQLELEHPANAEQLGWQAPLPRDMQVLIDALRGAAV